MCCLFPHTGLHQRNKMAPLFQESHPDSAASRGRRRNGSSCVSFYEGGNLSLKSPSQPPLLYYWPELCHVSHASANQQAGSSSCPKAAEGNMEKGSFPSQVSVLWERRMGKPILPRQPVTSATILLPDAHPLPHLGNIVMENGSDLFWGYKEVISLGGFVMGWPTKSKHPLNSKRLHKLLR